MSRPARGASRRWPISSAFQAVLCAPTPFFVNVSLTVARLLAKAAIMKKPEEDPELKRQQAAAAQEKINTMRDRLATETDQSLRMFGARNALSGARMSPLAGR